MAGDEWNLTAADRRFLRSIRVAADDRPARPRAPEHDKLAADLFDQCDWRCDLDKKRFGKCKHGQTKFGG